MSEGALALTSPVYARELRVRAARRRDLLAHFAGAFDLAEECAPGHAAGVAYLAHQVAVALGLGPAGALRALDAGLLHASGAALNIGLTPSEGNAWVAAEFGLDEAVSEIAAAVHERWDGGGATGRARTDIPVEALCVAAAHWVSDFADGVGHPLRARAHIGGAIETSLTPLAGPIVADALRTVLREDETWMTVFGDDLAGAVAQLGLAEVRPSLGQVYAAAHAMGQVIDASAREPGRALRVSVLASELAAELRMPEGACDLVGVAGCLLDIGQLGVPRGILGKPSILTVDEMELMRRHPGMGARLLEAVPGLDELSTWVEQHHERPDGRGYPNMLDADELSLPSLILSVADAYWALRARRPYRTGHSAEETLRVLREAAGQHYDADVVSALEGALPRALETLAATGDTAGSDLVLDEDGGDAEHEAGVLAGPAGWPRA